MRRFLAQDGGRLALFLLAGAVGFALATGARRFIEQPRHEPPAWRDPCPATGKRRLPVAVEASAAEPQATEAMAEVNAARAKRGLPAFQRDDGLTKGALACATYRAERGIKGHTRNDFAFLPEGTTAKASGCGALTDEWGWGTCCTYERWTRAGAAWARGKDGRRYMHLFVAN